MTDVSGPMNYPVVSAQGAAAIFAAIDSGEKDPNISKHVVLRTLDGLGVIEPIDFDGLVTELEAKEILFTDFVAGRAEINDAARNEFEATYASEIYACLAELPIVVLDDKDFWRWLIVGPLRWYVYACDVSKDGKLPNESKGLGGESNFRRNPVTRAYFRGRLAADVGDPKVSSRYGEAAAKSRGGAFADKDFLKSHILGVQVGNVPEVAAAFIRESSKPYLPAGDPAKNELGVRQFVKYFTRLRSEVVWTDYDHEEAERLGRDLRHSFDGSSTNSGSAG